MPSPARTSAGPHLRSLETQKLLAGRCGIPHLAKTSEMWGTQRLLFIKSNGLPVASQGWNARQI